MNITSAQDPPYFPGPFSINGQGWLQAPPQGLKGQAQKVSMTWDPGISMDEAYSGQGHHPPEICSFVASLASSIMLLLTDTAHTCTRCPVLAVPPPRPGSMLGSGVPEKKWDPWLMLS